jgi:hypothetical protein
MTWLGVVTAIIQLIVMVFSNKLERDKQEKARKDDLHAKLEKAIADRDASAVNDLLCQLRS